VPFLRWKVFKVPQQHDFAIVVRQSQQRLADAPRQLLARHLDAGRTFWTQQTLRQLPRRVLRKADISRHGATRRPGVPALQHEQAVVGDLPQPQSKRGRWPCQVFGQAAQGFNLRLLDDIGRIDPAADSWIHTKRNHPAQVHAMPCEQLIDGPLIAGAPAAAGSLFRLIEFGPP